MGHLYAGSWTVMVFLGKAEDGSDKAVQLLKKLASAEREKQSWELRKNLLEDPRHLGLEGAWLGAHALLNRSYWTRLWVVQEISLAPFDHLVFVGNTYLSWSDIQDSIISMHDAHWGSHWEYVKNDCEVLGINPDDLDPRARGMLNAQHMKTLCEVATAKHMGKRLEFVDILDIARNTCCSEPLDRVYGLLNVMEAEISCAVHVSYTVQPAALFTQIARVIMQQKGRMDLICEASLWKSHSNAPSWAPDWIWQSDIARGRAAHQLSRRRYQADAGTIPQFAFSPDGLVLTARGAIVGTIDGVRESKFSPYSASRQMNVQHSEALLMDIYGSLASLEVAFYRTLLGDIGDFSASVLDTGMRDERGCLDAFATQGTLYQAWKECPDYVEALKIDAAPQEWYFKKVRPGVTAAFESRKSSFWWFYWISSGRTLVTTREGRFGWAPENVTPLSEERNACATYAKHDRDQVVPGDLFVVLFGCKVPLVVREYRDGFRILGEGFLDGFMDGMCQAEIENGRIVARDMKFY